MSSGESICVEYCTYINAEDVALLPPCGQALQSCAFKFKSSRLNDISRDLLGAATSCETPPARASRNKPLQRKTQWIPNLFCFVFFCFFKLHFLPPPPKGNVCVPIPLYLPIN